MPKNLFRRICYLFTLFITCITFIAGFIILWYIVLSNSEYANYWWRIVLTCGVTWFVNGLSAALLHEEKAQETSYRR